MGNKAYYNNLINNTQNAYVKHDFIPNSTIANNENLIVQWDNGKVGNYYSDYHAKYPDAKDTNSGIGDTPYAIGGTNVDHYPLTQQIDISTNAPTPPASLQKPELPVLQLVIIAIAVLVACVAFSLLFYRSRRTKSSVQLVKEG